MPASFRSNVPAVKAAVRRKLQAGALNVAGDVLALSTPTTPFKSGDLRQRRRAVTTKDGARAQWLVPYAAVQNRGARKGKPFSTYTTPGTGPGFAEAGIEAVKRNLPRYFK